MANRVQGAQGVDAVTTLGAALSGVNPGVSLTYTCPTGKTAIVRFWSASKFTGAPTVGLYVTVGGVKVEIDSATAQVQQQCYINLNPADTATVEVITGVAASVFDSQVTVEEYSTV